MSLQSAAKKQRDLVVIAHNIRSLHNLGSLFRTGDAAGVSKIYCTGYTGDPLDSKASKVSLGAEKNVPWERVKNISLLLRGLKQKGFTLVALEQHGKSVPLTAYHPRFPLALIVGNEVRGISPALLKRVDRILEIPMRGKKESLNVSVAFGIAVYQLMRHAWDGTRGTNKAPRGKPRGIIGTRSARTTARQDRAVVTFVAPSPAYRQAGSGATRASSPSSSLAAIKYTNDEWYQIAADRQ